MIGTDIAIRTRTIHGIALQAAMYAGKTYTPPANTTLNEKLNIAAAAQLGGVYPKLGYYCIGSGAHTNSQHANGKPFQSELSHQANNAAPFDIQPFVLRPVSNDLTVTERANYRLRRRETHNGNDFWAYYLKPFTSMSDAEILLTTVNDSIPTTVPYVATSADLSPTPLIASSSEVVTTSGDYLSVRLVAGIVFTEFDVAEYVNVAKVLYGDERLAIISEMGLVTAVDRQVQGNNYQGGTFNYTEAVAAQVGVHITTYRAVGTSNEGFTSNYNLGGTEDLYGLSATGAGVSGG